MTEMKLYTSFDEVEDVRMTDRELQLDFDLYIADIIPYPSKEINKLWLDLQAKAAAITGNNEREHVHTLSRDFTCAASIFPEEILQQVYEQGHHQALPLSPTWLCLLLEGGTAVGELLEAAQEKPGSIPAVARQFPPQGKEDTYIEWVKLRRTLNKMRLSMCPRRTAKDKE